MCLAKGTTSSTRPSEKEPTSSLSRHCPLRVALPACHVGSIRSLGRLVIGLAFKNITACMVHGICNFGWVFATLADQRRQRLPVALHPEGLPRRRALRTLPMRRASSTLLSSSPQNLKKGGLLCYCSVLCSFAQDPRVWPRAHSLQPRPGAWNRARLLTKRRSSPCNVFAICPLVTSVFDPGK